MPSLTLRVSVVSDRGQYKIPSDDNLHTHQCNTKVCTRPMYLGCTPVFSRKWSLTSRQFREVCMSSKGAGMARGNRGRIDCGF